MNEKQLKNFQKKYVINAETGCWEWTASKIRGGYGQFNLGAARRSCRAHRAIYEHFIGPIPADLELDHLCRNRACVNPAHLEPVSHAVNVRRGSNTKLTKEAVLEIRNHPRYWGSGQELAAKFGVTNQQISYIRSKRSWK